MGEATWTPTGEMRWLDRDGAPSTLQQRMQKQGFQSIWSDVPSWKPPQNPEKHLAEKIVDQLLKKGIKTEHDRLKAIDEVVALMRDDRAERG